MPAPSALEDGGLAYRNVHAAEAKARTKVVFVESYVPRVSQHLEEVDDDNCSCGRCTFMGAQVALGLGCAPPRLAPSQGGLAGLALFDPRDGGHTGLAGLASRRPFTVLVLLRRYGCGVCRDAARVYSGAFRRRVEDLGGQVVGVGHGFRGLSNFLAGKYWRGELLIDCFPRAPPPPKAPESTPPRSGAWSIAESADLFHGGGRPQAGGYTSRAVWKSTAGFGRPDHTLKFLSSVKSTSIRLIFGRIDCSHRVLEVQPKSLRQNIRIRAH
ncbi:hypothetical protein AURANDRAFT_63060 [Aureococcus anophagefferens]|uniref:Uncharacterized protein n=1 Tax=Aureococcus anophagefferens TaxID=44056 RepID=F0Y590_AURAN|nr:hypothetical protein AURANDRAFT_63060 [Aureococcus anophagefferens]EGB09843.1 hypothetical protein AURANDRAFT_63060 [Aureococcus anophagefferens]|eukprot:XP_009035874.1 hypothetical protein AURANDRAFT_63060 [Aureococcus anophagefferens]